MRRPIIFVVLLLLPLIVLFGFGLMGKDEKLTEGLPEIPKEAIEMAKEQMKQNDDVKDVAIVVEGNYVAMAVVMNNSGSEEYAKELGQKFAQTFGNVNASLNNELKGSADKQFGDIFNYYNLSLAVATSAEEVIAAGTKETNANSVTWQEMKGDES
jgi:cation transport regulator ChaB